MEMMNIEPITIDSVLPPALKEMIENGADILLVDVREPFEHEHFNIGGTLVPLGEIMQHRKLFDTSRMVVCYCAKGIRSRIAIQRLQDKFGFTNLINLEGGMDAWQRLYPFS